MHFMYFMHCFILKLRPLQLHRQGAAAQRAGGREKRQQQPQRPAGFLAMEQGGGPSADGQPQVIQYAGCLIGLRVGLHHGVDLSLVSFR